MNACGGFSRRGAAARPLAVLALASAALALALSAGCGSSVLQPGVIGDPPEPGEQAGSGDIASVFTTYSDWIRPNELIVKYREGTTPAEAEVRERAIGAEVVKSDVGDLLRLLSLPAGSDLLSVLSSYVRLPEVEYAEPNLKVRMPEPEIVNPDQPPAASGRAVTVNDPLFSAQWHLTQIGVEQAWQLSGGGTPSTVVAIVDTGVAYEDYGIFSQADDLAQTHFVQGYDYANGDAHPNDDQGHGTHVAGTIAQSTGNGIGCAGVAPNVSIMPVKVLDFLGSGSSYDVASGIRYAVDNGADVINMSLGGPTPDQTMRDACQYAYDKNVVVVCAAGNDSGPVNYPAGYSTTICVSAVDRDKAITEYSSRGPEVDVAAPGGDTSSAESGGVLQQTFQDLAFWQGFDYVYLNGTSMASPHVAGAVGLLVSNGLSTANNTEAVRSLFSETCEDLGGAGKDDDYGYGLLRIDLALESLGGGQPDPTPDPWDDGDDTPPIDDDATVLAPGDASPWVQFGSAVNALPGEVFIPAPDNAIVWAEETQQWLPLDRLEAGRGAFLELTDPINAYFDLRYRVSPSDEITVPLSSGWNLIGNPYDRAMPWNGDAIMVRTSDGGEVGTLNEAWDRYILVGYGWTWNPDTGAYDKVGDPSLIADESVLPSIPVMRGMWVRSFQDDLVLAWRGNELDDAAATARARGRDARLSDPHWQALIAGMRTAEPPPKPGR